MYCNNNTQYGYSYMNTKKYRLPGSLTIFTEGAKKNSTYGSESTVKTGSSSNIFAWDEHKKGLWNAAYLDGHVKAASIADLKDIRLIKCVWYGKNSFGDPMQL